MFSFVVSVFANRQIAARPSVGVWRESHFSRGLEWHALQWPGLTWPALERQKEKIAPWDFYPANLSEPDRSWGILVNILALPVHLGSSWRGWRSSASCVRAMGGRHSLQLGPSSEHFIPGRFYYGRVEFCSTWEAHLWGWSRPEEGHERIVANDVDAREKTNRNGLNSYRYSS